MTTNFESLKSNDRPDDGTAMKEARLELMYRHPLVFKPIDAAPGYPLADVTLFCGTTPELKAAPPDSLFDCVHNVLKGMPAIKVDVNKETGVLIFENEDLGKSLQSIIEITDEHANLLNKLVGMKIENGKLSIACDHQVQLKSLLPDSKDIPDSLQLSIKNPEVNISKDPETKAIRFSFKGITAFHKDFPFIAKTPVNEVIASKKIDKDGNATCELKIILPVGNPITKSIPMDKKTAKIFDDAMAHIPSGTNGSEGGVTAVDLVGQGLEDIGKNVEDAASFAKRNLLRLKDSIIPKP